MSGDGYIQAYEAEQKVKKKRQKAIGVAVMILGVVIAQLSSSYGASAGLSEDALQVAHISGLALNGVGFLVLLSAILG